MPSELYTLLLRLQGPLQSWGESPLEVRQTRLEPTKSGVIGLICCCLGMRRNGCYDPSSSYRDTHITVGKLAKLKMGVRVDRQGSLWKDFHTAGAPPHSERIVHSSQPVRNGTWGEYGLLRANGKGIKRTDATDQIEPVASSRYYLCDASFVVALMGAEGVLGVVRRALQKPHWPPYLGRKCCVPSVPIVRHSEQVVMHGDLLSALRSRPWFRRDGDKIESNPIPLRSVVETDRFGDGAWVENDVRPSYASWSRSERIVREQTIEVRVERDPLGISFKRDEEPKRQKGDWNWRRLRRAVTDKGKCVFCGRPAENCHHITYRRWLKEDIDNDLRSVCGLCHQALTQIGSLYDVGIDHVDPLAEGFRNVIIKKRNEICERHIRRHTRRHHETL